MIKIKHKEDRNIIINIFGAFIIKGGGLLISLFLMPIYLEFFKDKQILGIWFTLLSVLSWILNFDLGIGNGLRNYLTDAIAKNNRLEIKKNITAAYISVGGLNLFLSLIFFIVYKKLNWNIILNINESILEKKELEITVLIVFVGIILQLFFKLVSSIIYAFQKPAINNLIGLTTSILNISLIIFISKIIDIAQNIKIIALIHVISTLVPLIVANIFIFTKNLKNEKPEIKYYDKTKAKQILSLGGKFFFVQIFYMIIMTTNEYLITLFTDSAYVVEYRVYFKLFTLISMLFMLALSPIWSAVTKAITEGEYDWIKKIFDKMILGAFIGTLIQIILIPFVQKFTDMWLGINTIKINTIYLVPFSIMGSLMIFNGAISSVANGMGLLKPQLILFGLGALFKVPLSYFLIQITNSWIGVVIANCLTIGIYCIFEFFNLKNQINKFKGGKNV